MIPNDVKENSLYPLHVFRFHVEFQTDSLTTGGGDNIPLCDGAFSECTGLEASMEPKVIKEGGRNYGDAQRSGPVTFSTVILKRGMTTTRDLWKWFELVTRNNGYAYRLAAIVRMYNNQGEERLAWKLDKALPIKFKTADLNAKGTEVGIEELHLAHEGLSLVTASRSGGKKQ
jgi:phage tail-like protein